MTGIVRVAMVLLVQTTTGPLARQPQQRWRFVAPGSWVACRGVPALCAVSLWLLPGCQAEPEAPLDLKLARKVEQVLEDPTSLPLAATEVSAVALPAAVTEAAAATPTQAAQAATAVAAADPAAAAVPGPGPAPAADQAAAEQKAKADQAAAEQKAKADQAAAEQKAKADQAAADQKAKATKADKAEKSAKADKPDKPDQAEPPKGKVDDIVVPEGADATDLYTSGKRKLAAGDYAGAIMDLRASNKLRYSVRTLTTLGRAYFDAGQMAQAEKSFKSAGTFDEAMLLLAQLYQQSGKPGQARKVYEQFLQVHGDHPKAEWVRKMVQAL